MRRKLEISGLAVALIGVAAVLGAQNNTSPPSRLMTFFATSAVPGTGDLGGLSGADGICQKLAQAVGAGNHTWHAYLSIQPDDGNPGANARGRIGSGPWYNAQGVMIAANVADLHGDITRDRNNIQKANVLTEKGELIGGLGDRRNEHDMLTGSDSDGRAFPAGLDTTCNNWSSDGTDHRAMLGHSDRKGGRNTSWNSAHMSLDCSKDGLTATGGAGRFYCFAIN